MRIHCFETGRLTANRTFLRATGWRSGLLGRPEPVEFPVLSFLIEHPEGVIALDTGLGFDVPVPRWQRRFVPVEASRGPSMAEQMTSAGLDAKTVTVVLLTHLDRDHVGGIASFPAAQVLVHRSEHEAATSWSARPRYRSDLWPEFTPTLYDLDGPAVGPFPASRAVTQAGDVQLVPLAGHSAGHVGVLVDDGERRLLFSGDHVLRLDWLTEDLRAGHDLGLGIWFADQARQSTGRLAEVLRLGFAEILPSHDESTVFRLTETARFTRERAGNAASG